MATCTAHSMERIKKRMEVNDPEAFELMASYYGTGNGQFPLDKKKAVELRMRAANLGSIGSHCKLANAYRKGEGVNRNMKKAIHHYQLGAIGGDEDARYYLGGLELQYGNTAKAMKHFSIGAKSGCDDCLEQLRQGLMGRCIKHADFAEARRAHADVHNEAKSEKRDEARRKKPLYYG